MVFTSGGSEANNHALKGVFYAAGGRAAIVTSAIEHPAVLEPCRFLERLGARVTRVAVDAAGLVDPDEVRHAIGHGTTLASIMHANNEVGTIQPIAEIARVARERGALVHTDAAQSVGKITVDVGELGVDLLTVAGHKLYAPKGVGALYIRRGVRLEPLIHGAGHEGGRRAGTENVPPIVALGAACRLARLDPCEERMRRMRDLLWDRIREIDHGAVLNGHPTRRLPNTLNVSFPGRIGHELLAKLDGVAASTGSACHTGTPAMSPVLGAMGLPPAISLGALRFSVGRPTTADEIERAAAALRRALAS